MTIVKPQKPTIRITATTVAPGLVSAVADNPSAYFIPLAASGVLLFYIFYVLLANLPLPSALVGVILGLIASAVGGVWRQITDEIGMAQSLQVLNILSGLLASPLATWDGVREQIETMDFPDWIQEVLHTLVSGEEIEIEGTLPQTVNLWRAAQIVFAHPEQVGAVSAGLSTLLKATLERWGTHEQEAIMAILESTASFAIPGAVGLAMVVVVLGFLGGVMR